MFNFFKSKKKEEIVRPEQENNKEKNPLINTMKERYGFVFSGDVEQEEFDRRVTENANRRVLPIDIDPSQIVAYTRYKGADIGFYLKNNGFGFYLIKPAPVRLFISMTRRINPRNQHKYMIDEIMEHIEVEVVNVDDVEFAKEFTDTYFQKYFLMLIPLMEDGNRVMMNRNGLSIEIKDTMTESELLLMMSFLQQCHESLNKYNY